MGRRRTCYSNPDAAARRIVPAAIAAGSGGYAMKVHVKQSLKTDVASALKLCTDQKNQEAVYAKLPGTDVRIKREGKAPNVRLKVSRTMPANPPAAIKRLVPATNQVSHTETWRADGDGHVADIAVEIRGVPVKITGTKALRPAKGGCSVEWTFDVTSGLPIVGGVIASFAGAELEKNLADEYKVLKAMA